TGHPTSGWIVPPSASGQQQPPLVAFWPGRHGLGCALYLREGEGVVVEPRPVFDGPADHERAPDDVLDRHEAAARVAAVVRGVGRVVAVVTHDPQVAFGHGDLE